MRNVPDSPNVKAFDPSVLSIATEVTNTTAASGTRMTAIVLNWRFR